MSDLTPRERARAETLASIKALALEQLAAGGAGELSLRAIARKLNLVSSAIYRYYPSRDDLITALIVDAYGDLADRLDAAGERDRRGARRRWTEVAGALREWAKTEPHRFALIYGTPIPSYRAPADTVAPAGRVMRALAAPLASDTPRPDPPGPPPQAGNVQPSNLQPASVQRQSLQRQLKGAAAALDLDADALTMQTIVTVVAGLIGLLTLELGGHFVGGFEPADDLYAAYLDDAASRLAL